MNEIAYQWGKFAWWVYHANPEVVATVLAAVVSVGVTAILVVLTYYNVRASFRQARGMLQPALKIEGTIYLEPTRLGPSPVTADSGKGRLHILNVGTSPVVLLDVTIKAKSFARPAVVAQYAWLDEQISYASSDDGILIEFDFSKSVSDETRRKIGCSYEFRVVASDLSREIAVTYLLEKLLERPDDRIRHRLGVPWRVRLKYRTLGIRRVYYHFKLGARMKLSRFRKKEKLPSG
jgi:hypothetical protein